MTDLSPVARTCGHCREPMRGYASQNGTWLCHPDDGLDCYRLVTVYKHLMPCFPCASVQHNEPGPLECHLCGFRSSGDGGEFRPGCACLAAGCDGESGEECGEILLCLDCV